MSSRELLSIYDVEVNRIRPIHWETNDAEVTPVLRTVFDLGFVITVL